MPRPSRASTGDPSYDDLARVWPRYEAVKFTNQKKVEMIQRLVVAIEQRQVSWPREWAVLTDELKWYEYAIGTTGAITYGAPSGFHDDAVIALARSATVRHGHLNEGTMASMPSVKRCAVALRPGGRAMQ